MRACAAIGLVIDLDAELLAAYPSLVRRLALVMHDPVEAEVRCQGSVHACTRAQAQLQRRRRPRMAVHDRPAARVQRATPTATVSSARSGAGTHLGNGNGARPLVGAQRARTAASRGAPFEHVGRSTRTRRLLSRLGVRTGTVSSWLSRAKARLRRPWRYRPVSDFDTELRRRLLRLDAAVPDSAPPAWANMPAASSATRPTDDARACRRHDTHCWHFTGGIRHGAAARSRSAGSRRSERGDHE